VSVLAMNSTVRDLSDRATVGYHDGFRGNTVVVQTTARMIENYSAHPKRGA
jgi:hypothetical protein